MCRLHRCYCLNHHYFHMVAVKLLYQYEWNCQTQFLALSKMNAAHLVASSWRIYSDSLQGSNAYQNDLSSERCLHCLRKSRLETRVLNEQRIYHRFSSLQRTMPSFSQTMNLMKMIWKAKAHWSVQTNRLANFPRPTF